MEEVTIVDSIELRNIVGQQDAFRVNTILLPEMRSKETANGKEILRIEVIDTDSIHGMPVDEPAIDMKAIPEDCIQEDVLAEPLADADKLIETELLDMKSISDIFAKDKLRIEPKKPGRRGRRPASEKVDKLKSPPPETARTTRSRNLLKSPQHDFELIKKEEKNKKIKNDIKHESKVESNIDEKQCRICLSKENLTSIFLFDDVATIADKIMTICTTIKILEKDFLPQFICNTCLASVNVAFNLKSLCENTDKQLRSKLKRSKNKIRRPTEFVLIDCKDFSEESEDEVRMNDDEEFHISNESGNSEPDTDSDSSYGVNKKKKRRSVRRRRSAGVRRRGRLPGSSSTTKRSRQSKTNEIEVDDGEQVNKGDETTDDESAMPKKKRSRKSKTDDGETTTPEGNRRKEHPCVYCNEVFPSIIALREHKKNHAGEKPFTCPICSKPFKLVGSFNSHLKRHKEEDDLMCHECEKHFPNKTEFRRHKVDVHGESAAPFVCEKCKRAFTTKPRLDRHQDSKCPGFEVIATSKKIKPEVDAITLGRDLFKCVAPMTTTYWSDSFSD